MSNESALQNTIVSELTEVFSQDPRVKALWLKGSLARPDADRHSDIDLHVWMDPDQMAPFLQDLPGVLSTVRPLLHLHPLFDGHMIVTLLQAAPQRVLALDLFLDTEVPLHLDEKHHKILFDRENLIPQVPEETPSLSALQAELEVQIRLFWRTLHMLPSIERGELIQGMKRLTDEVEMALQICSLGRKRFRDIGDNRGNALLLAEEQQELQQILTLTHLSIAALVHQHLALAEFVVRQGRLAAENLQTSYPVQLETAVLEHVYAELSRMDLISPAGRLFEI